MIWKVSIKIISVFLILLFCQLKLLAQSYSNTWIKYYSLDQDERAHSVIQTDDGGFILAGVRLNMISKMSNPDAFLIRTNSVGDTLWTRAYGGSYSDGASSIQQTNDGGFIFTGVTSSFSVNNNYSDLYLVRIDSAGNTLWTKAYGDTYSDGGNSVKKLNNDGYIIAGYKTIERENSKDQDLYLIRTDMSGDTIWTRSYGGLFDDYAKDVDVTFDGGFIITGAIFDIITGRDIYLIRTDSLGDTLWTKRYGGTIYEEGAEVLQTADSGFLIAGTIYDPSTQDPGDFYLIKTNSIGDTVWTKIWGGARSDWLYSICEASNNQYVVAGKTNSFGAGMYDVYLLCFNLNGDTLWSKTYGGLYYDLGHSIQKTIDGGFIIGGASNSHVTTGTHDFYLIRTNENGNVPIKNHPNKTTKNLNNFFISRLNKDKISINFTLSSSSDVRIEVYNTKGSLIREIFNNKMNKGFHSVQWIEKQHSNKKISAGVYICTLKIGKDKDICNKIIIK